MAWLRMPEVTISLRSGRASITSLPNGVRSRIRQTMAQPCSALTTSAVPLSFLLKALKVTSLATGDQSATVKATF